MTTVMNVGDGPKQQLNDLKGVIMLRQPCGVPGGSHPMMMV